MPVWLTQEIEYLEANYHKKNNAKIAGHLSLIRKVERTAKAIADKLSLLGFVRNSIEKREICGVGHGKRCPCCLETKETCMCHFVKVDRKLKHTFRCHIHDQIVWRKQTR